MAHPDKRRQDSEKGQREHAGTTSEASDAGLQSHSQGARGRGPTPIDDTGATAGAPRDTEDAPKGEARELEGRPAMSSRGMEQSGDRRTTNPKAQPTPPDRTQRDRTGRR